jgi:terminase small subunit-like protein
MQTKNQPKDGRSPGYSAEIAETICERLINGESLRAICADPRMPAKATVFRWLARNQEFRRSYALARECQAEDLAFEILEIADDSSRDYVKKTGVDGKVTWVFDKEHFARQRLKIKALNWMLAGMAPRKYGNR